MKKAKRETIKLISLLYFTWRIAEQDFEDYKSKYLDLYDKVKTETRGEKASILEEVDFE